MQIVEPRAVVGAESLVVLGAQGARINQETGMRDLSQAGLARTAIAATIIAENPDTEGVLMLMGSHGLYSGGGAAPTEFGQTEAAAHQIAAQHMVAEQGVDQGKWKILAGYRSEEDTDPATDAETLITKEFASSTIPEVKLILDAIRALKAAGKQEADTPTYIVAGKRHLDRVSDILNALNDPLADKLIGVVNHDEREGFGATVTRGIYRALVLRGANKSVSAEELVRREKATVGRIFSAKNAVMGLKTRRKSGKLQASQGMAA